MRTIRLFIVITILTTLAGAVPAFATLLQANNQNVTDPCAGALTADQCMWSPMGAPAGGGYASCTASASQGQTCQAQLTNSWGDLECAGVYRSAYCSCNAAGATGSCSYVR